MRRVEELPVMEALRRSPKRDEALQHYVSDVVDDARSALKPQQAEWKDQLRQYEARPRDQIRKLPFPGAPNIEVPLTGIGTDAVAAQIADVIWQTSPPFTVRATKNWEKHGKAFQVLVDKLTVEKSVNYRGAFDHGVIDFTLLGNMPLYVPWVEATRTTGTHQVLQRGPRVYSVDPDLLIVPPGASEDIDDLPYFGIRFSWTEGDYQLRKKQRKWKTEAAPMTSGVVSDLRYARERVANTREPVNGPPPGKYDILDLYLYYPYSQDIEQHLLATYDMTSRKVMDVQYQPYDERPCTMGRYQTRAHMFFGFGIGAMMRPFQEETSEWHCFRMANAQLANARVWASKRGHTDDKIKITPFKTVQLENPKDDLIPLVMADVYPSALQYEAADIMLAERRIGVNEMSMGQARGNLGSRTPATTAVSLLRQFNRRFVLAYESIRQTLSEAMRQCLLRYQERVKLKDPNVERDLSEMIGADNAELVLEVFRTPAKSISDCITIEVTASSEAMNRDAERQNIMLANQQMLQYYERSVQLLAQSHPEYIKKLAQMVVEKSTEFMDRFLRTFDSVRDPAAFLIDLKELESGNNPPMGAGAAPGLDGLGQLLLAASQNANGNTGVAGSTVGDGGATGGASPEGGVA